MKAGKIVSLVAFSLLFYGCGEDKHNDNPNNHNHNHNNHNHNDPDHKHDKDGDKDKKEDAKKQPAKKTGKLDEKRYDHFGEGAHEGKVLTPSELAANIQKYQDQKVLVRGEVVGVCKTRGCWLIVSDGKAQVRVKATCGDWGVPTDCEGRSAIAEGVFAERDVSVAEQRHYLEDAGKLEEMKKVTEPVKGLGLQAEGVALAKLDTKK